jgi:glyoxalase family protein
MDKNILGIHHVTAIAGDPQKNLDFYAGILGLRLVKKTVNFDDPYTYHLYYGDEIGHPGTLLTFFPWSSQALRGRKGTGQITAFSFSISHDALGFWKDRLKRFNIQFDGPTKRFSEEVITTVDHDGFQLEIVASSMDDREGWESGGIPSKFAIRGFHCVALSQIEYESTAGFLITSLGFSKLAETENRFRFDVGDGRSGTFVDLLLQPNVPRGSMGVGIVHHVAWRTPTDASQREVRDVLLKGGNEVTPVIDRNYFHSIYFHEPGGVLFEVATDPPGFLIDERKEDLGTGLMLPKQYESYRNELENVLTPLRIPEATRHL